LDAKSAPSTEVGLLIFISQCVLCTSGPGLRANDVMPSVVPMVWRGPKNYISNCYFCMTDVSTQTSRNKRSAKYLKLSSALTLVPHSKELPVSEVSESLNLGSDEEMGTNNRQKDMDDICHDTKYVQPDSVNSF
jgi:hypothetical protein